MDACGERCAAEDGCVLFNYQQECDGPPGRGACYAYRGTCKGNHYIDGCWKLFAMRSFGPDDRLGEQPSVGDDGGTGEADADSKDVSAIPSSTLELSAVLDLERGVGFERVEHPRRCALVGSSSTLLGSAAGDEIDSYDTVIRMNRIPRGDDIQRDLGNKTDVLFINVKHPTDEAVELLLRKGGSSPPRASCRELDNCRSAAIVLRSMNGHCDPRRLAESWGRSHPFIACVRRNIAGISWGFSKIRGYTPSTGFVAFVTFLPLCQELDLFGFEGTGTADGHGEWGGHDLGVEHGIQDAIVAGKRPPWTNSHAHGVDDPHALDWILAHAAKVQKRR